MTSPFDHDRDSASLPGVAFGALADDPPEQAIADFGARASGIHQRPTDYRHPALYDDE
jgi:hypothetical protein